VWVIGSVSSEAADAFTIANQLPNSFFTLLSVGVLTAVIVPNIVQAPSEAFVSKLLTLGGVLLLVSTVIAGLLTPALVVLQLPGSGAQGALAVAFAWWCVPQLFFYGLYALIGETLNARGSFGPHAWAPIVNNLVTIAGLLMFAGLFGNGLVEATDWTPAMIATLAGTATVGIIVQTLVVCAFWRRAGVCFSLNFRWRGVGFRTMGYTAGWTLMMAVVSLVASFIQNRVVNSASGAASAVTVMSNAWLVLMLPFSLIVISIGTPYFTRFSRHVAEGSADDLRRDFADSVRLITVLIASALAALVAAAIPASRIFTTNAEDAGAAALVLYGYLAGLLPLAINYVVLRVFYANGDTRRPFLFTCAQCVLVVAGSAGGAALVHAGFLPIQHLAATVALFQSLASALQLGISLTLVRRHLGSLSLHRWGWSLLRGLIAAIPAASAGWGVFILNGGATGWTAASQLAAVAGSMLIGAVAVFVHAATLAALRAPELGAVWRVLTRRG
jgi:putative peptidoglycan lipid II flippase